MSWLAQEEATMWRRESYAIGGNCLAIWEEGDHIHVECRNMEIAG